MAPRWLSTSLEEMERKTASMLKLIDDEDGETLATRTSLYFDRRPKLINEVHELQRMYRTLAAQYQQQTGGLQRNVASDLESEQPSTPRVVPDMRLNRAPGFDFFLRNTSGLSREVSPGPDFEQPGVSSLYNSPRISVAHSEEALNEKTIQMDSELYNDKEKMEMPEQGLLELQLKVASYEVEIAKLKTELESVRPLNLEDSRITDIEVSDPEKVRAVFEELQVTKGTLLNLEVQIEKLSTENKFEHELIHQLQDQIKEAKKDAADMRSKLDTEMKKSTKRADKIAGLKGSLIDRDAEIRRLKDMIADLDNKYPMHAEISRLTTEKDRVEEKHRELEVHYQSLKNQHAEVEKKLTDEIEQLKAGTEKREQPEASKNDLDELKLKYDSLMRERDELIAEAGSSNELKIQVGELQDEIEIQRFLISETAEEKREAIRQLCFSLEHYRKGYEQLRGVTTKHIGLPILLAS